MKPKCFFRGCDHKMKTSIAKKKLPLLIASQSIHCLTKASTFVPQCKTDGATKPETGNHKLETIICLCTFEASVHRC